MPDVRVALHGMFPAGPTDAEVTAVLDAAAAAGALSFLDVERTPTGVTRHYREVGVRPLGFSYALEPPCQVLVMSDYHQPGRESYRAARIATLFTQVCAALDVDLARSDLGAGYGFVQERELLGPIEFIDWYQYFGPRCVERIGRERLLTSPAFSITEVDRGAIVMMLAADPWDAGYSRAAVARHLGVTLTPCTARNPATGEPIIIPWR